MSLASRSLSLVVVETLTAAVVVLFAILGNAVLRFALSRKPRTKNSTLVMFGSLALADFLFTSTTAPLFVLSLATGEPASNDLGCQLNGSLRGRRNRGRGRGARKPRKNEGVWGEGRGNACHKNPIRFISAFAGKRKFLIG